MFDELLTKLGPHLIFINKSNLKQFPVEIQLAITLSWLGHYGSSTSVEAIAQWAGVSAGLIVKATKCVMITVLSLHDDVIHWPSLAEKDEAKEWVEDTSGCPEWRDGFCMVDGTLVPLFEKPGYHGETYFDRKSNYSMNVQVCHQMANHRTSIKSHLLAYYTPKHVYH
jgi:hypothetical protein